LDDFGQRARAMWGGAFDPEPRAPPASAPYPDAQYAMTASEFDARLETWGASAHDGSFDAQITESFAFRELTRHREIRAAGAFAFAALFPLTASVFHTFAALPFPESSFDTDPVTHAMALRGGCDVQSGEVEKVRQRLRAAFAAFASLTAAVAVVVLLRVVGEHWWIVSRITTTQTTKRIIKRKETMETKRDEEEHMTRAKPHQKRGAPSPRTPVARLAKTCLAPDGIETPSPRVVSPPRFSPPPPPPPAPTARTPGSLGPLRAPGSTTGTPPPPPPPPVLSRGGTSPSASSPGVSSSSHPPPESLRRSLAMTSLRRTCSHRANAKLRRVNYAANEAPTSAVAKRVKSKLNPADVLAELADRSPYLANVRREARTHCGEIANLRAMLEALDGTQHCETLAKLRDKAETILKNLTDESRVLRELSFPEARLESLRSAAANRDALVRCATRAKSFGTVKTVAIASPSKTTSGTGGPPTSLNTLKHFLDHASCLRILDECVSVCDAIEKTKESDAKRFAAAGIGFDFSEITRTREAAVAMSGRFLRTALQFCCDARELRDKSFALYDDSGTSVLFRDTENANPNASANASATPKATPKAPRKIHKTRWNASNAQAVSPHAFELWVLRSACDLAYRAYAACGGVDAVTEICAREAEVAIEKFEDDAWRGAETVAARAAAATKK